MQIPQRDLHQQLRTEAIATREKIAALVKPFDESRLNEHPEPERWSVAQVLEHLCVANEKNEAIVTEVLRDSRPDAGAMAHEWKPSFIGKLIAGGLLKPKPLKSPKPFRPGTPRNGVAQALQSQELDFLKEMDDAVKYDWRAARLRSAALPKWAPKMNLGDGFRIHVVHLTRHARQIERLVGKL
jgi:hypothetical protein